MKKQPMRGIAMAVLCLALTASAGHGPKPPRLLTNDAFFCAKVTIRYGFR